MSAVCSVADKIGCCTQTLQNWLGKAFTALVTVVVVAGLVMAFWPQPVQVDVAPVERGEVVVTVDEDGKTRIREKYLVSAPLSGRVLRIEMDPGDEVTANQTVLAVMQPRSVALTQE